MPPRARNGIVVQTTAFRLNNGRLMEGEFDRTRQGLFLHHQFGGKLYRWGEIDTEGWLRRAVYSDGAWHFETIDTGGYGVASDSLISGPRSV